MSTQGKPSGYYVPGVVARASQIAALQTISMLAVLLATLPARGTAQEGPRAGAASDARLAEAARLESGRRVRLYTAARSVVEGPLILRAGDTLVVGDDRSLTDLTRAIRIHAAEIDSLWVQTSRTRTGAWVGLLAGGVAMTVVCATSDCQSGDWVLALGVGIGGGVALGAALGSLLHTWHRRYP